MNPLWSACSKVDSAGENMAAWRNVTMLAGVAEPMTALAAAGAGGCRCHRLVSGDRSPCITMASSYETVNWALVMVAVQPASHNCPNEMRECVAKSGTMWTWVAVAGRTGMLSEASWVDTMIVPLGLRMEMGLLVTRLLMRGISVVQKWAVLPVSRMAGRYVVGAGLPAAVLIEVRAQGGTKGEVWIEFSFILVVVLLLVGCGLPPRHNGAGVGAATGMGALAL